MAGGGDVEGDVLLVGGVGAGDAGVGRLRGAVGDGGDGGDGGGEGYGVGHCGGGVIDGSEMFWRNWARWMLDITAFMM